MRIVQNLIGFLGRVCICAIFLSSAMQKLLHWGSTKEAVLRGVDVYLTAPGIFLRLHEVFLVISQHLPLFLGIAIGLEILGSLLILLGLNVRLGAFFLLLFLVPATILIHHFWFLEGKEQLLEMTMFLKNVAIAGGLLTLLAFGSGEPAKPKPATKE